MSRNQTWMVAAIAAAVLVAGCNLSQEEYAPAANPTSVAFEGKLVPKYVGNWKTSNGSSSIDIDKDGGVKIETVSQSMLGKSDVVVSGKWLAGDDSLLFRYLTKTQEPVVLKYSAVLTGKSLTLSQAVGRLKTVYQRK
jgi:hypothetical protein